MVDIPTVHYRTTNKSIKKNTTMISFVFFAWPKQIIYIRVHADLYESIDKHGTKNSHAFKAIEQIM